MNRIANWLWAGLIVLGWSALMFGGGWIARMTLAPVEFRTERVYTSGSTHTLLDDVWDRVRENFIGTVPSDTVREYGAIRGALSTLDDKYTLFTEPQTRAVDRDHMRGSFGGIGTGLRRTDAGEIVLSPNPNGPAERAGVRDGDILIGINGVPLPKPAALEDVAGVRGEVGTTVTIEVRRGAQTFKFSIVRAVIEVPSVEARTLTTTVDSAQAVVGYIRISSFTERTAAEVRDALAKLQAANSQGYLIDVRDNGGGLLAAAVDVASEFVSDGPIVIEQKRDAPEIVFSVTNARTKIADGKPIAVLVNGNTASASEIVAGAIQDNKRGPLVGQKTYGKGSVQLVFDLRDGSAVRVTTAKWLTPNKRALDGVGLTPDTPVDGPPETQLEQAVALVAKAIKAG